jgi:hypothetical protein
MKHTPAQEGANPEIEAEGMANMAAKAHQRSLQEGDDIRQARPGKIQGPVRNNKWRPNI